ncbi:hypothetical protein GCM10023097_77810 [Streptomyces collinus]
MAHPETGERRAGKEGSRAGACVCRQGAYAHSRSLDGALVDGRGQQYPAEPFLRFQRGAAACHMSDCFYRQKQLIVSCQIPPSPGCHVGAASPGAVWEAVIDADRLPARRTGVR